MRLRAKSTRGDFTTERILFICEQSLTAKLTTIDRDETTNQSERNMKTYASLFEETDEGAVQYR